MSNDNTKNNRNMKAVLSLLFSLLSFSYSLLITIVFWVSLSIFAKKLVVPIVPIFILSGLAVFYGYISIRKIKLSQNKVKSRFYSILGIVLGLLSLFQLLIPKFLFIAISLANPPNYEIVLQLQETKTIKIEPMILRETKRVISSRLHSLAVPCKIKSISPDKIIVNLKVLSTFNEDKEIFLRNFFLSNLLSFHLVRQMDSSADSSVSTLSQGYTSVSLDGQLLYVKNEPELIDNVEDAEAQKDPSTSQPVIAVDFKPAGTKRLMQITSENTGRQLAIMVDDKVYSAPRITQPISKGHVWITGNFTMKEANQLAIILGSGALPLPIRVVDSHFLQR